MLNYFHKLAEECGIKGEKGNLQGRLSIMKPKKSVSLHSHTIHLHGYTIKKEKSLNILF